jgi:uncharacterized protein (DUF2147 family)
MLNPRFKAVAWLAVMIILPFGVARSAAPDAFAPTIGTWINPYNNVKVRTSDCGKNLCGWVIWANAEAEQEAREGGVQELVGAELLRDYHLARPGEWTGRVFVPDLGRTFYSTIRPISPDALQISGCILHGLICKSQVWRKV